MNEQPTETPKEQGWSQTDPLLMRPTEAARTLGISRSRIYELIRSGVLPSVRVGSSVRIPVAELRMWITSQLMRSGH